MKKITDGTESCIFEIKMNVEDWSGTGRRKSRRNCFFFHIVTSAHCNHYHFSIGWKHFFRSFSSFFFLLFFLHCNCLHFECFFLSSFISMYVNVVVSHLIMRSFFAFFFCNLHIF